MSDYVFRKTQNDKLEFIGNFEALYRDHVDPWGQSGLSNDIPMNKFYEHSRNAFQRELKLCIPDKSSILEIGCGSGETTMLIKEALPKCSVVGCDISESAINKAKCNFPDQEFYVMNVLKGYATKPSDVVILSNMIWYVLHDPEALSKNIIKSFSFGLNDCCYLFVQNALFKSEQSYAVDVISSIGTLTDFLINLFEPDILVKECYSKQFNWPSAKHLYGVACLKLEKK